MTFFDLRFSLSNGVWSQAMRDKDYTRIVDWFTNCFFAFGALALGAAGIAAYLDGGKAAGLTLGVRVFALALILAAACTIVGWILGLVFGIPRSLARPAAEASAVTVSSRVNTNLEDISDWLTKIIVGVGLTQLNNIPVMLDGFAKIADRNGFGWADHGYLLAIGIFLYFVPGGFWLGYIGTRTIVTLLFNFIDQTISQPQLAQAAKVQVTDAGINPGTPAQKAVDATLLAMPLKELTTNEQLMAWSGAQTRAHNFADARTAVRSVLVDEPANGDARQQLSTVDRAEMLTALYAPPPGGFQRAIELGEKLLGDPSAAKDVDLHVWLASAYGQQYGFLSQAAGSRDEAEDARQKVLREIRAALAADPKNDRKTRERLRSYWQPQPGSIDNDLHWLAGDSEVADLLNPQGPGA